MVFNKNVAFVPPVINCEERRYDQSVQKFLLQMLQRDWQKRRVLSDICNCSLVKSIYIKIENE